MGQNTSSQQHSTTYHSPSPTSPSQKAKTSSLRSPIQKLHKTIITSPISPRFLRRRQQQQDETKKQHSQPNRPTPVVIPLKPLTNHDEIVTPRKEEWLHMTPRTFEATVFRFQDFKIHSKCLGQGAFARVMMGTHVPSGRQVAVKVVDKAKIPGGMRNYVTGESVALGKLSHECIIKLLLTHEDEVNIYMFLEYMAGGDLHSRVEEDTRLSERETKVIFAQILSAVDYSHQQGFCHRDLKLENILVSAKEAHKLQVRLIDFGFAGEMTGGPSFVFTDFPGSVCYAAPELICGKPYTGPQADIYSLGVVMYTMLYGRYPFYSEDKKAMFRLLTQEQPFFDSDVSCECAELIGQMMEKQPQSRPTIAEIWKHPWMLDAPGNPHAPTKESFATLLSSAFRTGSGIFAAGMDSPKSPLKSLKKVVEKASPSLENARRKLNFA